MKTIDALLFFVIIGVLLSVALFIRGRRKLAKKRTDTELDSTYEQLDYILKKALVLTESKFGFISVYDEKKREFSTIYPWSPETTVERGMTEEHIKHLLKRTGVWGEAVRRKNPVLKNDFTKHDPLKKEYPEELMEITRFMTVPVLIDEKMAAVIALANKAEDYDYNDVYQITVLMNKAWSGKERREREKELEKAYAALKEKQKSLELLLDSTAEGIYGLDTEGNCTFCNASCVRMLGYKNKNELIGKNMHLQIHHSHKDGSPMPIEECKIFQAFMTGKGTHVEDEVLWRMDGTSFEVEYFSYPQYKEGEVVGAVVTFWDITKRKKAERKIKYLSFHDPLTGLYNRRFFEKELKRLDTVSNYPLAIIVGDINGLKLTNDVFGHSAGDLLLRKATETFRKFCRADDIIARTGGDEFVILLPKTTEKQAEKVALRIKTEFAKKQVIAVKGSISMGCAAKVQTDQDILTIYKSAEDRMYRDKTLNRGQINTGLVKTIIETLHKENPGEEKHSKNVAKICCSIGKAMGLSDEEVRRVTEAGFYHDIGKIVLNENLRNKEKALTNIENKEIQQHPVVGYRILHSFSHTFDLAEAVLAHHERWDGSGYPKGLKGEEIPKTARIIAVAESYDALMRGKETANKEEAVQRIKGQAGSKFDPDVVKAFVKIVNYL